MSVIWNENPGNKLEINGKKIEYACYGPTPNESMTIILLHHGLGCMTCWRDFPQILSERTGLGVFTYSRVGYGNSDCAEIPRPLDFMSQEAMDSLPQIIDLIGLNRGILVGHSDGATIAAIHAGSVIDYRIRGIVVMAPHFFTEELTLEGIKKLKNDFENGEIKSYLECHRDPGKTFFGWCERWLDPKFQSWNVGEVIDYIRVPVLAIQGREDQFGTLMQIDEIENRIYAPLDISIFEDCQHTPHVEQPEQTLDAIAEFTSRLERIENEIVQVS